LTAPRPFRRGERIRLWLSYQRYALLLAALAAALTGALVLASPAWYLWAAAVPPLLALVVFAARIGGQLPRKLRATALASRRIASGRFRPHALRGYCGDPCYRVVAREILVRAGVPAAERRALIRRYAAEQHAPAFLLLHDPTRATPVVVVTGGAAFATDPNPTERVS
jgi:hypothetical protein